MAKKESQQKSQAQLEAELEIEIQLAIIKKNYEHLKKLKDKKTILKIMKPEAKKR